MTEEITPFNVQLDNAPDPIEGVSEHELAITCELAELYVPTLALLRGGIDLESQVAGTPVVGATQVLANGAWNVNQLIRIVNQMGNGTALPAFTSVVGSVDGALVANDDYDQVTLTAANGDIITYIVMQDLAQSITTTTVAQNITITYNYTPNASRSLSTGGLSTIAARAWRFTNRQVIGGLNKNRVIDVYRVFFEGGTSLPFTSDNADDPLTLIPVNVRGKIDGARTAGDQLFKILDEVAVA